MTINLPLDVPMLSIGEYARRTGVSIDSVRNQMEKGHLPFIQYEVRGTRYVNMVQLYQRCSEANADKQWN